MSDDSMPMPQTKAEVMDLIATSRAALERAIDVPDESQLLVPGPDGWTIKDHLAHIAIWEQGLIGMLQGQSQHEAMGLDSGDQGVADASADAINEVLFERHRGESLSEVLDQFVGTHAQLLATLEPLSYDDLMLPRAHYLPDETPPREDPIAYWIAGNTWGHYDEHTGWITSRLEPDATA